MLAPRLGKVKASLLPFARLTSLIKKHARKHVCARVFCYYGCRVLYYCGQKTCPRSRCSLFLRVAMVLEKRRKSHCCRRQLKHGGVHVSGPANRAAPCMQKKFAMSFCTVIMRGRQTRLRCLSFFGRRARTTWEKPSCPPFRGVPTSSAIALTAPRGAIRYTGRTVPTSRNFFS